MIQGSIQGRFENCFILISIIKRNTVPLIQLHRYVYKEEEGRPISQLIRASCFPLSLTTTILLTRDSVSFPFFLLNIDMRLFHLSHVLWVVVAVAAPVEREAFERYDL